MLRSPLGLVRLLVSILGVLSLVATTPAGAASLPRGISAHAITVWTTAEGLPQENVTAVLQTRDHYLWVGTEGGLARFDGLRFTTFRRTNSPAFSGNNVHVLFEDRDGWLWIGTDSGLVRHQNGQFEPMGFQGRHVYGVCQDRDGDIWIATEREVFRRQQQQFVAVPLPLPETPNRLNRVLFANRSGRTWLGSAGMVGLLCWEEGQWHSFSADGAIQSEVLCMAQMPDGALWIGTGDGLIEWRGGRARRLDATDGLASSRVTCLYVDQEAALWAGTLGLQRIGGGEMATIAAVGGMNAIRLNGVMQDREGNLWVAALREGLMRVRRQGSQLINLDARNAGTGFRTVMQADDGTVWLAQGSRGALKVDPAGNVTRFPPANAEDGGDVLSVFATAAGEVLVGTRGALEIRRGELVETHPELPEARVFFADRDGTIWMGLRNGGLATYREGRIERVSLPPELANCTPSGLTQAPNGDLYFGTWAHGLVRISGGKIESFSKSFGPGDREIRAAFVDRDGNVWVGPRGMGLALLDRGSFITADWTSELFDQRIDGILTDENDNLWLSSERGVYVAARRDVLAALKGEMPTNRLRVSCVTDGLRKSINDLQCFPNLWQLQGGQVWLAARGGVLICDAAVGRHAAQPPMVHIERVVAPGAVRDARGDYELAAGTTGLLFEYVGLSFTAPQRVAFQYRMVGIDPDWVDAGTRRVASYSRLPPGRYRFEVRACNAEGVWNDVGASVAIVQRAYPYQNPWVLALGGVALAGSGFAAVRWRLRALSRDKKRLEVAIAERTRELVAAKEQAEASTRAKSEFLQTISHEIRNPLHGVVGLVGILREQHFNERQHELLSSLRACAKSLDRVFDQILRFTRLEEGHVTLQESPFRLRELLDEVAGVFRVGESGQTTKVTIDCDPDVPDRLIGDEDKIQTILANLIGNAVKHAPGSPVDVTVSADSINAFAANVTFVVTDHGEGIPAEEQEIIFQKFARGTRAKRQRVAGAGLGLATCQGLAELMGGHIGLDSNPGEGASFFLSVRLKRDLEPAAEPAASRGTASARERALVVDDQVYNQLIMRRIAEHLGYSVDVASGGADALRQVAQHTYSVVFVDWDLADQSGEEVGRAIRAHPSGQDAMLLATTGHDTDEIRQRARAAGFDDFALKPLSPESVTRCLEAIRHRRARGATAGSPQGALDTRVFRLIGRNSREGIEQAAVDYVRTLDAEVALMHSALKSEDRAALAKVAHRLKTHAALVQAASLSAAVDKLERSAIAQGNADVAVLVADVAAQAAVLKDQLNQRTRPAGAA